MSDDLMLSAGELRAVALFPLPNVVLLPRVILPLHIFEPRYRRMTADVLTGDGLIAMALLRPGWKGPSDLPPAIEPVVCVGRISRHELLPDGRYNLLLSGLARARVLREDHSLPYRRADLKILCEQRVLEIDLDADRRKLGSLLDRPMLRELPLSEQLRKLVGSTMPTGVLADLFAFYLIEDLSVRQALLGQVDPAERVKRVISELTRAFPEVPGAVGFTRIRTDHADEG